ncbi:hypothetical protein EDC94DRAFT_549121 [Helicostylum pulchrum]|uniref:Uncharacterized protein n=1 Tax=Helicostylum pulchrum TaxID=562976 RepID=A0ABP9YC26_9FUNG|nr:hypothetical protein EDC94DRAFT_549121 [Helicostylum pulchrum]
MLTRPSNKWLTIILIKWMGYSSFAAALVSVLVYMYKKKHYTIAPKLSSLQINTASCYNLNTQIQLLTPPPSPEPTKSWSTRLLNGVISATRKRKRLTISLKNTVLWNPSRDVNTPIHAFHENTVTLLNKLVHLYDIYVITHLNSTEERDQINRLLSKSNIDIHKILFCSTEQGKLHIIQHLKPDIHIEGGCETTDGSFIINHLDVKQKIWIKKNNATYNTDHIQLSNTIHDTWIAQC